MKKLLILTLLVAALWVVPVEGASSQPINQRPTSDWFSDNNTYRNVPLMWMREVDPLIGAAGGGATGTGTNFYVDSGVSNEGQGLDWANATDTLDEAINLCTANAGDWIHVAEGHAESGSAANLWDADVAGITIYHHGNGSNQGTYTFADTDTTIAIGAANVTVYGGRYLAGISEVVAGIIVEAAGTHFTLVGAEFPEPTTSTFEFNIAVQLTTASNDVSFINCTAFSADATGADHWLNGGAGVVNRLTVRGCQIHGEYAISAIFSDQIDLENYFVGNEIQNMTTAQHCIENTAASTGLVAFNSFFTDAEATTLDPGSMKAIENYVTTAVDASGILVPVPDVQVGSMKADTTAILVDTGTTIPALLDARVEIISATTDFTASTDVMFSVAGGPIEILSLYGLCTTLAAGSPGTMVIEMDATTAAQDGDFSTTVNVDALAAGDVIRFTQAIDEGVLTWTTSTLAGQPLNWFAAIGDIEQTLSSTGTGNVTWYMTYRDITGSSTVTAP